VPADLTDMPENPWLHIPSQDYEAHMTEIGQAAVLREIFLRVYSDSSPRRLLVLGCTTGSNLELVDSSVTETIVGIDINGDYIDVARKRLDGRHRGLKLLCADVLAAELPASEFDLIHAALLFEYVDPTSLFRRIATWLADDGVCSTVTQNPASGVASVSKTAYESLLLLDGHMSLYPADEIEAFARQAGLWRISSRDVPLAFGKSFSVAMFKKAPRPLTSR
jgi:SAM-dependent methyltransferase